MTTWIDTPLRSLGRLAWNRSFLTPHPKASVTEKPLSMLDILASIKEKFEFQPIPRSFSLDTSRPRLTGPKPPALGSYQPPCYFTKGVPEKGRQKPQAPIWHLLTETIESPISRPVPRNASLIKSLCKGKGVLTQNKHGFLYLDIDDQFITAMAPYTKEQQLIRPPYFNLFSMPSGAHIPVIPQREAEFHYLDAIAEIGQTFTFEIEGLYSMIPDGWPEVEEVWFFQVRSPELEALRRKYFLSSLPSGHNFHIVVGVKAREKKSVLKRPLPMMRISPSFVAA